MQTKRTQSRRSSSSKTEKQQKRTATLLAYYRLSKLRADQDIDGGSTERQAARVDAIAEQYDADVIGRFSDDNISAAFDRERETEPKKRPDFQRLLAEIERVRPTYVASVFGARLLRNLPEYVALTHACARAGTIILSQEGALDPRKEDDYMLGAIRALQDAAYVGKMRAGLRSAAEDRRENKRIPRWGGVRPYGLERDGMTPKEDEAAVIREIVQRVLRGHEIRTIARELNERGEIPPARATAETRERLEATKRATWTANAIKKMLRRASICGYIAAPRADGGGLLHPFAPVDSGEIGAIITRETFDRVQAVLNARSSSPGGPSTHDRYMLSGVLFCECGARLAGSLSVKKNGRRAAYYKCPNVCLTVPAHDGVDADGELLLDEDGFVKAPGVESAVRDFVIERGSDPEYMHEIAAAAQERSDEWHDLQERKQTLERKLDMYAELIDPESGEELSETFANRRTKIVEKQLADVKKRQKQLDATPADVVERVRVETRERLAAAWDAPETTHATRRAMVKSVCDGFRFARVGRGRRVRIEERLSVIRKS